MTTDPLVMMLVGGMVAAVPALFLALMKSHASAMAEVCAQRDVYKAIGERAIIRLEQEAVERRKRDGLPAVPALVPVEPEHSSPVSAHQWETAAQATLRARLVAAELGMPPMPAEES